MMRFFKCFAATLAFLLLLSGCQLGGNTSWAYSCNDDGMPSGVYLSYLLSSYTLAVNGLAEAEGLAESGSVEKSILTMTPAEILKQQYEGMSVSDWMVYNAQRDSRHYYAIKNKIAELGLGLTQEDLDYSASLAESSMQTDGAFLQNNGISESSMLLAYQVEVLRENLFNALYTAGGQLEVPQSELDSYFAANYGKAEYMFFEKPSVQQVSLGGDTEDSLPAELDAEQKRIAESYLQRMKAGESVQDLTHERNLEKLTDGADPAATEKPDPSQFTTIVGEKDALQSEDELTRSIVETPVGQCALVDSDYFFFVFKRVETTSEDMETYRRSVLRDLRYDDFLAKLDEWSAVLPITVNQAAINRYQPSSLNLER